MQILNSIPHNILGVEIVILHCLSQIFIWEKGRRVQEAMIAIEYTNLRELNVVSSTLSSLVKEMMSKCFSRLFNELARRKEPQPTVISFKDYSSEVISPFIEFMYSVELPVEVIRLFPMEFFILGSIYEIEALLIHVAYCPSIVTEGNVGKILELREKYGAEKLLRKANLFMKNRGCEGLNRSHQGLDTLDIVVV